MTQSLRIVVADDELDMRDYFRKILPRLGHTVVAAAETGEELLAQCRAQRPNLVITDIKMPGIDGIEAARRITAEVRVPVLILTAFSQRNLIEEARDAGVAAYLVKPFQRSELVPAIDQAMTRVEQQWAIDAEVEASVGSAAAGGTGSGTAEDKLETRRMVDSAKGVLMERHGLSEADAFGFIQKTAMGTRSRMIDVSRQVLEGSLVP